VDGCVATLLCDGLPLGVASSEPVRLSLGSRVVLNAVD
jgi:hypothetical protein